MQSQITPDEAFALEQDASDPLRRMRDEFCIPEFEAIADTRASAGTNRSKSGSTTGGTTTGGQTLYFVGNSLGLMPKATRAAVEQELDDWSRLGVEAHFHGKHPWMPYHEEVRENLAKVVGALPCEVVAMNSLTTNLHLLMVSFYRPTRERYKIVIEDTAFPSDSYAVKSQLDFHSRHAGFNAADGLIRLKARPGEDTLRTDEILEAVDHEKNAIALVMLGGVNYLTGQLFDMPRITAFARERGIVVGWDLAHAAGNIDVKLHDCGPDFAAWCSYKYLNSGPGAVAGAFVHERHMGGDKRTAIGDRATGLPRFEGWWGTDPKTRFKMGPDFEPVASVDSWQLSNPPILALAPLRVSLEIFAKAGMSSLRAKSERLTSYLEWLIVGEESHENTKGRKHEKKIRILTPSDPRQRGCQLSLAFDRETKSVHAALAREGVVCDFREPNVIRVAPVPLYNSFHDVWRFAEILKRTVGNACQG
jgi:kynureninase